MPLISPALPILRDTFAVTDAQASLLISAYFAAGIVLSLRLLVVCSVSMALMAILSYSYNSITST